MSVRVHILENGKMPTKRGSKYDLYTPNAIAMCHGVHTLNMSLKLCIPKGYIAIIHATEEITKKDVHITTGIIDSEYTDELCIYFRIHSNCPLLMKKHEKIAHMVLSQCYTPTIDATFENTSG